MRSSDDSPSIQRPLAGVRVAVTRDPTRAEDLAGPLRALGAEPLVMPLVRVEPLDVGALAAALADLVHVDWLAFTSRHGVRLALEAAGGAAGLAGPRVAAVGMATAAALREAGVPVSLVPARHDAEGLLAALEAAVPLSGARVLYVAARDARDVLPEGLRTRGATVTVIPAYRTLPDADGAVQLRAQLDAGAVDVVTLAAPSAVRAYAAAAGPHAARVPVVAIGPVTAAAAREAGLPVAAEAEEATAEGIAHAAATWAAGRARL